MQVGVLPKDDWKKTMRQWLEAKGLQSTMTWSKRITTHNDLKKNDHNPQWLEAKGLQSTMTWSKIIKIHNDLKKNDHNLQWRRKWSQSTMTWSKMITVHLQDIWFCKHTDFTGPDEILSDQIICGFFLMHKTQFWSSFYWLYY